MTDTATHMRLIANRAAADTLARIANHARTADPIATAAHPERLLVEDAGRDAGGCDE